MDIYRKFLIVTFLGFTGLSIAQESMDQKAQQELMAAYMELAQPGKEHKLLASLEGQWNMEIKVWTSPGMEPMLMTGKAENKMILGGRFLLTTSDGGEGDMYTETHTLTGFDRRHKKYTTVGYDTWGTYYATAAGTSDESGRTITMYGEDRDPIIGKTQKYDMVLHFIDENSYRWEVIFKDFRTPNEEPFKMLEILYTRQ
jgi:hypothetical protein